MTHLLSIGFKPLFLCTGFSALILIGVWVGYLSGLWPEFSPPASPLMWHGHEMLFGFVGSAIGGFLLTAVANWTRRPPVHGALLLVILLSWIAGRLGMAFDFGLPLSIRIAIDASYWLCLTVIIGREILVSKNYRNLPIVLVLTGFLSLSGLFHFFPAETLRAGLALVCVLITLIAGRIIPAFTTNWLRLTKGPKVATPVSFNTFDKTVALFTLPTLAYWCLFAFEILTGWLLIVVSILHAIRLARWRGHETFSEPLMFSMHAAYAWLPIGLCLLGLTAINSDIALSAGIHALGIGAIATMILAVATRATKGHSGQALRAGRMLSLCFILIQVAVLFRIGQSYYPSLLIWSGATWLFSFGIFTLSLIQIIFPTSHINNRENQQIRISQGQK